MISLTVGRVDPNASPVPLTLTYDEENRLIEAASPTQRSVYVYDGFGRRVECQEYAGSAPSNWTLQNTRRFVYDGWRVMEELDPSYATVRSYTRGLDLSGTDEGAGGIGGLLGITVVGGVPSPRTASYFYDGNGNVTDLAFDDGTSAAHYVYSPFGERLVATGTWAETNPYQFSSKERDALTGFYYYGLRYYSPSSGRWLNRDPIEEQGHELLKQSMASAEILVDASGAGIEDAEEVNMYAFVLNSPVSHIDPNGEAIWAPVAVVVGRAIQLGYRAYKTIQQSRKAKAATCAALWTSYHAACNVGCQGTCCNDVSPKLASARLCVSQRKLYIDLGCDEVGRGYGFKGKLAPKHIAEQDRNRHVEQLRQAREALSNCLQKVNRLCRNNLCVSGSCQHH